MLLQTVLNKRNVCDVVIPLLVSVIVVVLGFPKALAYTLPFFLFVVVACIIDSCKRNSVVYYFFVAVLVGLIAAFTGFRDFGVGWDTNIYVKYYFIEAQNIHSLNDFLQGYGDKGFLALAKLSTFFSQDAQSLLFIESLFIVLFLCLGIHEINNGSSQVRWSTVVFFWCFIFLNISLNLMRQYCSMSLMFWAFALMLNGKWKRSIAVFVMAFFFHSSVLLCVCLFGCFYLSKMEDRKMRGIYTLAGFLGVLLSVLFVFKMLPFLAGYGFVSETYAERYGANNNFNSQNIFGVGIIVYIGLVYYAIFLMKRKKIITEQFAYIAFTVHSLFWILRLSAFSVNYLSRMSSYYYYFDVLCFCVLLNFRQLPNWIRFGLYFVTVFLWYRSYIVTPSGATFPYHSGILGI